MKKITSAELLALTDETFLEDTDSLYTITVECVDGNVKTTNRHVQYMHGLLQFNRKYNVPVYKEQVLRKDFLGKPNQHLAAQELYADVVFRHLNGSVPKTIIAKEWLKVFDSLTNASITHLEHFASTVDAMDLMDFVTYPEIKEMREKAKLDLSKSRDPESKSNIIVDSNTKFIGTIKEKGGELWSGNGLYQHIALDGTKLDQVCQVGNFVGYVTEINSVIYPIPTGESFAEGMNYPYTYATNGSLGKKAVTYNKTPISDTETLNRISQQMCSQLENIHVGDCGSRKTSPIVISKLVGKSMIGMYHITKDDKVELITKKVIKASMGKVLDVRTIAGCDCEDEVGRCSVCSGVSSNQLVNDYTVGGAYSCLTYSRNSQKVLKTKHVEIINFTSSETLNPALAEYLKLAPNGKDIYLDSKCPNGVISFMAGPVTSKDKARNGQFLSTVFGDVNIDSADITTFTDISTVDFNPNNDLDEEVVNVKIKDGTVAYLSRTALHHIRENPKCLSMYPGKGNRLHYRVDLSGYDNTAPLMTMPFKHHDSLTLHNALDRLIHSPEVHIEGDVLTDYTSFGAALTKMAKLTYGDLKVNMALLQFLILPYTIRDMEDDDWRMTNRGDSCTFGKLEKVRERRSLSVVIISSGQSKVFGHLSSLVSDKLSSHCYDKHFL